jgi:type IV secretory pathway VirD2 relaxase
MVPRQSRDGRDLVISRDYVSHGLRARAEHLDSLELGPRSELEIRRVLERTGRRESLDEARSCTRVRIADCEVIQIRKRNQA